MEELNRFVVLAQSGRFSVTDLCEQFGISRKTGYKHLERYAALGLAGLRPRSHRPHGCPQRVIRDGFIGQFTPGWPSGNQA
jgi:transposase